MVTAYKFKGCRRLEDCIILLNMMPFVITVHSKMLATSKIPPCKCVAISIVAEIALVKNK